MLSPKLLAHRLSVFCSTRTAPLLFPFRRRRLRLFGADALGKMPVADLDFASRRASCGPGCASMVGYYYRCFQRFSRADSAERHLLSTSATLAAVDLQQYEGFADFSRRLSSSTNFSRDLKKARRLGYEAHLFNRNNHVPDIVEIRRSLKWRSGGPVPEAFIPASRSMGQIPDTTLPLTPPVCVNHWGISLGLFLPQPGYRQGNVVVDRKLVAYLHMDRTGNTVCWADGMAHGEHMRVGAMKLLYAAVIEWLLDGGNPLSRAVRYFTYGAIEAGRHGLCQWKHQALFTPHRIHLPVEPS
jgi:hypothetical protein